MKKKAKRYYGMTVTQIGILAAAAVFGLLVISLIFIFMLMPTTPQAQLPVATQVTLPTLTVTPNIPVIQDTETPTPAPVIATSIPPADWVQFETQGATLWLPKNFVGGDISGQKQETIQKVSSLGRYFSNVVAAMKNVSPDVSLWMIDKTVGKTSTFITTVTVHHYVDTEDKTIDQFMKADNNGDYDGTPWAMFITINQTKKINLLGLDSRFQAYQQQGTGSSDGTGMAYYIKDGTDFWVVDYMMNPNTYVSLLPMVEESIHTFNLVK